MSSSSIDRSYARRTRHGLAKRRALLGYARTVFVARPRLSTGLRSLAVTFGVVTMLAGCGGNTPQPRAAAPRTPADPYLVVVGDSLAAGRFATTQAEAFPQQLAAAAPAQ